MRTEIISVFFYHKCFVNKCRKVSRVFVEKEYCAADFFFSTYTKL